MTEGRGICENSVAQLLRTPPIIKKPQYNGVVLKIAVNSLWCDWTHQPNIGIAPTFFLRRNMRWFRGWIMPFVLAYFGALLIVLPFIAPRFPVPSALAEIWGELFVIGAIVWFFSLRIEDALRSSIKSSKTFSELGITEVRVWRFEEIESLSERALEINIVIGQSALNLMSWLDLLYSVRHRPRIRLLVPDIESSPFQKIFRSEHFVEPKVLYTAIQERAELFDHIEIRTIEISVNTFLIADRTVAVLLMPAYEPRASGAIVTGDIYGSFGSSYRRLFDVLWDHAKKLKPGTEQP
jgi:hypothetical protein